MAVNLSKLKPSALLLHALADLKLCEADPKYKIQMSFWHTPISISSKTCTVCLAGAVMVKTLKAKKSGSYGPASFDTNNASSLTALDKFRKGELRKGLLVLKYSSEKVEKVPVNRVVTPYSEDSEKFLEDMMGLHRDLLKAGY